MHNDNNHDLRVIPGQPSGDQERYGPKENPDPLTDGYAVVNRADGGRRREGRSTPVKGSLEGMDHYRPRGR